MEVSQAQYRNNIVGANQQITDIIATINNEVFYVPLDPANRHYIAIQEWVAEGNTIEDAE